MKIIMTNRRTCTVNGVNDVLSFDLREILLETEQGMLMIRGNELHVNRLTLDKGEVDIDGRIDSFVYSDTAASGEKQESLFRQAVPLMNENVFLLHAFLLGVEITFLYDILRILRRVFAHGIGMVSLEDIAFWIYCAGKVFLLMFRESNGNLRWFAVLGAVLGMYLYHRTLSPLLVKYVSGFLQHALKPDS